MDNVREKVKAIASLLDEKKAYDLTLIDISEISVMADYFLLATALNPNHARSLSDEVEKKFKGARQVEGYRGGTWILMDYGDFLVHIFCPEERSFYNLERIWQDGKTIDWEA